MNNNGMGTIYGIMLVCSIVFLFLSMPFIFGHQVNKTEILENVSVNKEGFIITIHLSDGTEYNRMSISKERATEYVLWLSKGINRTISFSYGESGLSLLQIVENDFRSPKLHLEKNTAIEQVMYKEDGIWWWEKPPVRVVLGDGSNFIFYGSDDDKFDIYSTFIVYKGKQVIVHYMEEFDGDVEFDYIEKLEVG